MPIHKILFVDDDPEDSEFFTTVAAEIDPHLQVTVATSTSQLFQYLEQDLPDLLFMDSFIMHESGLASIREIRKTAHYHQLPIIMYTGSADKKNMSNAFDAGATAYVVKPHTLTEIKTVLQKLLMMAWTDAGVTAARQCYMDGKFHHFK